MNYIVSYADENGRNFAMTFLNATAKDNFIQVLTNAGIKYGVVEREEKKWRLCRVVFELRDIEPAMKDPNYKYSYTFGDPKEFSKTSKVVKGQCSTGETKSVFVINTWMATEEEIADLKKRLASEGKLKTGHLSLIVGKVV